MTEKLDPKSADDILKKYDKESDTMMYKGVMAKIVSAIAITFSVFELYTATFGVLDAQLQRAVRASRGRATRCIPSMCCSPFSALRRLPTS